MTKNDEDCQTQFHKMWNTASSYGLKISLSKTEVLIGSKNQHQDIQIKTPQDAQLKQTETFKYLGHTLQEDGHQMKEIRNRCAIISSTLTKLTTMWKSEKITIDLF